MDVSYHMGWDYFAPDPGKCESCECRVCGTNMDVKRDCEGPTSTVMAMGGFKRKYDRFTCPNVGQDWHTQAMNLRQEIEKTSSAALAGIMEQELATVIETKTVSKIGA